MKLPALIEAEGLVPVADLSAGGYSWAEIHVYYKPDARRFFWLSEGGCSCNYFGDSDYYTLGDFQDGDRQAAIKALASLAHFEGDPSRDDVSREVAKIRNYRPEVPE